MTKYKVTSCSRYMCSFNLDYKGGTKLGKCSKIYVDGHEDKFGGFVCFDQDMSQWNSKETLEEAADYIDFDWFKGKRVSGFKRK